MLQAQAEKALEWLLLFLSLLQYLSDFLVSLLSELKPCPLLSLRESPGGVLSAPWAGDSQQSQLRLWVILEHRHSREEVKGSENSGTEDCRKKGGKVIQFAVDLGSKHSALFPTSQGLKVSCAQTFLHSQIPTL